MEHLRGLCDVLDLSLDEAIKGAPAEAKTGMEQAVLDALRDVPDDSQELALAMLRKLRRTE